MDPIKEYQEKVVGQPNLEDILEQLKRQGNYSVQVHYGEGTGCDDLDVPREERNITMLMTPVGYIGSVRVMWIGNLNTMRSFNFKSTPVKISNPPKREEYSENGYYAWGAEPEIDTFISKGFMA